MRMMMVVGAAVVMGLVGRGFGADGTQSVAPTRASVSVPVSRVSGKYSVEGNVPYDVYPQTVLDVIVPKERKVGEKLPGVLMFHGGGWIRTDKGTMSSFYNRFLEHGFVVFNAEYRMANEGGAVAPAAVQDALKAAKWSWDHLDQYGVDKTRFVVTGASAGGHLALMVGMCTPAAGLGPTCPEDFQVAAIVNGYGPTDVGDLLQRHVSWAMQWVTAGVADREALITRVSPKTYVRKGIPPLLVVQGTEDHTVPVSENQEMVKTLKGLGADAEIHMVAGAGHGFARPAGAWGEVEHVVFDEFLVKEGILPKHE